MSLGLCLFIGLSVWWWMEPVPSLYSSSGICQKNSPNQPKWPVFIFLLSIMYTLGMLTRSDATVDNSLL